MKARLGNLQAKPWLEKEVVECEEEQEQEEAEYEDVWD